VIEVCCRFRLHEGMILSGIGAAAERSPQVVFVARNGRVSWEDVRREFDARAIESGGVVGGFRQLERVRLFLDAVALALEVAPPTHVKGYALSFRGLKDALVELFGEKTFYSERDVAPVAPVVEGDPSLCPPPPPPVVQVTQGGAVERPGPTLVECCGQMLYKDVIYCIFLHLNVPTLLMVARVCRLFALMAKEDNLWRRFNEGGASTQFLSGMYQLKALGRVEFSFTGAEKRIHKGRCRELFASMGRPVKCMACSFTMFMTPQYWRTNTFVHFYHSYSQELRFCCANCTGKELLCKCRQGKILCTEEVLRNAVARYHNEALCATCLSKNW
jgi:hypothetical protein